MYSSVPPPGVSDKLSNPSLKEERAEDVPPKPRHVRDDQWKKFCGLRTRREEEVSSTTARRIEQARKKILRNVSEKLNEGDRQILMEEGVSLPSRKRKWKYKEEEEGKREEMEQKHKETLEWHNVRKLLDPNPQLRGVDPGRYAHKCPLEKVMDCCIEKGELERALEISEKLAQREFSCGVAAAFECKEYIKRENEEAKGKRKPPKVHWRFEPKKQWEMKGNM